MVTDEQIREKLNQVLVPGVKRSIGALNLVRETKISDQAVKVTLASTALSTEAQDWIKTSTKEHAEKVQAVLSREFEKNWDLDGIKEAPPVIKKLANALSGIRAGQILFTAIPGSEMILFATWWPWGNSEKISIRIGVVCTGKTEISESELTANTKKWFNIK